VFVKQTHVLFYCPNTDPCCFFFSPLRLVKATSEKIRINSHEIKSDLIDSCREKQKINAHAIQPQRYTKDLLVSEWFETYDAAAASMKWSEKEKLDNLKLYVSETLKNWLNHATTERQECVRDYDSVKKVMIEKFERNSIEDRMRSLEACKMGSDEDWEDYIYKKAARIRNAFKDTMFPPEEITASIISGLTPELKDALRGKKCRSIDELHERLTDYGRGQSRYMNASKTYAAAERYEKPKKKGLWCECEDAKSRDVEDPRCERCDGIKREAMRRELNREQFQRNDQSRWQRDYGNNNRNEWRQSSQRNYQSNRGGHNNNQGYQNQKFRSGNNQGTSNNGPRAKVNTHIPQNMEHCAKCYSTEHTEMGCLKFPVRFNMIAVDNKELVFRTMKINGHSIRAMIDTGATVSLIKRGLAERIAKIKKISAMKVEYGNGNVTQMNQACDLTVEMGEKEAKVWALVSNETPFDMVLGLDALYRLDAQLKFSPTGVAMCSAKAIFPSKSPSSI
jgi:predicted aspartyl protease